jgi:hypothetical protein
VVERQASIEVSGGLKVNDASGIWPHFTVTYTDRELRIFHKVMARRYARAQTEGTGFGILLAAIIVLGFVVFAAFKLNLIAPVAVRPVLFTAYFAFMTGVGGYYFIIRAYFRKLLRIDRRGGTWQFAFDDAGILYKTATIEVRLLWPAVDAIEDFGRMVALRFGAQGISIPSRAFANDEARAAFVRAAAERIKATGQGASDSKTG